MNSNLALPAELDERIESVLMDLRRQTEAECVLLANTSGQLINVQGQVKEINPRHMADLAAADVVATAQLSQLIGGDPRSASLHEGRRMNVYLFQVAGRFVLIVIFRASTLAALVHLFGTRAVERLHPLAVDFGTWMERPDQTVESQSEDPPAKQADVSVGET